MLRVKQQLAQLSLNQQFCTSECTENSGCNSTATNEFEVCSGRQGNRWFEKDTIAQENQKLKEVIKTSDIQLVGKSLSTDKDSEEECELALNLAFLQKCECYLAL